MSNGIDAADREIMLAEQAMGGGRFEQAEAHLARARQYGMDPEDLERLGGAIDAGRARAARRRALSIPAGIGAAAVCYAVLSVQQPLHWTMPVWAVLSFAIAPALAGHVTQTFQGSGADGRARFLGAFTAGALSMAAYTGLSLAAVHRQIASAPGASGAALGVEALVTIIYAAAAGMVAGTAASLLGRRRDAKETA